MVGCVLCAALGVSRRWALAAQAILAPRTLARMGTEEWCLIVASGECWRAVRAPAYGLGFQKRNWKNMKGTKGRKNGNGNCTLIG
jgi:hypothetical protein